MIGLLLLAIVAIYIAFAAFVVTRAKQRRTRIMLSVVMVLLPLVERTVATARFRWLCHTEHGLQVLAPSSRVASIETSEWGSANALLDEFEFLQRVYVKEANGMFVVLQRSEGGEHTRSISRKAHEGFRVVEDEHRDFMNINRFTVSIVDDVTAKVVAVGTSFEYYGDFLVRAFSGEPSYPEQSCSRRLYADDLLRAMGEQQIDSTNLEDRQ